MGLAVPLIPHWGRHEDHSFNQLSLFELRHGIIAPLELLSRQPIARLQRGNRLRRGFG
jgi:hypothetical protein